MNGSRTSLTGRRVLLVCDAHWKAASGALVARRVAEVLVAEGASVHAFSIRRGPENEREDLPWQLRVVPARGLRDAGLHQLVRGPMARAFAETLRETRPDVVHFASLEYAKPRFMIRDARAQGARVVLQPWTQQLYCARVHDYRAGAPCGACAVRGFASAYRLGCSTLAGAIVNGVGRSLLRSEVIAADAIWSTSAEMDRSLTAYGVDARRIHRGPLPFDPARLDGLNPHDGEEYVFHGQPLEMKGFHLLHQIIAGVPGARFGVYPFGCTPEQRSAARLAGAPRLQFDATIRWASGLAGRVAGARAILVPSLWSSTWEYALLEALGLGKPVVTFGVGAYVDELEDGVDALVVPPGDVRAYVKAVQALEASPELRARLGAGARRTFERLSSHDALARVLRTVYGERP